ncbi:MAG: hypothetical protein ACI8QZ_002080 [Chlamydiales bacterium]|jgi:hypothetical protein
MDSVSVQPSPRRRRIWKWARRIGLLGLVLLCLVRVTLWLWLPSAMEAAVSVFGVRCEYEDFDLSLLGADIELRHLELWDDAREADSPLAHVEYARLDIDVSSLLLFDLRVHRMEVDGVDVVLERDAGGSWLLPDLDFSTVAQPESGAPQPVANSEAKAWDLNVPIRIDAIRGQDIRLRVVDPITHVDRRIDMRMRVSDIGHGTRPLRIELHAACQDLIDGLTVEIEGRAEPRNAHLDLRFAARGIRTGPVAGLLEELGLRPVARTLDAGMTMRMDLHSDADRALLEGGFDMHDLLVTVDGTRAMRVALVEADATFEPGRVEVERVQLTEVDVDLARTPSGLVRAFGFDLLPRLLATSTPQTPAAPQPVALAPDEPFEWGIGRIDFETLKVVFEDAYVDPPSTLGAQLDILEFRDIGIDRATRFLVRGGLLPTGSSWAFEGTVSPGATETSVAATIAIESSDFTKLDPWLLPLGLAGVETAADLRLKLDATIGTQQGARSIDASLSELELQGEDSLLALELARVEVLLSESKLQVVDARVQGGRIAVTAHPDGSFHLGGFQSLPADAPRRMALAAGGASDASAQPTTVPATVPATPTHAGTSARPAPGEAMTLALDHLVVSDTFLRVVDDTQETSREFGFGLDADARNFVLNSDEPATGRLDMSVAGERAGDFRVGLDLTTRPGPLDLDLAVLLSGESVDLTPFDRFFDRLGLEPDLKHGTLAARIKASVAVQGDETRLGLQLSDISLAEAGAELAALDLLRIDEIVLGPAATGISSVQLDGLRADVRRDGDSVLHLAGVSIPPGFGGGTPHAAPTSAELDGARSGPAHAFTVAGVQVQGIALRWQDQAARESVDTALSGQVTVGALALGEQAAVEMEFGLSDAIESMRVTGTVTPSMESPRAAFDVALAGMRGGWIDHYLAPGQTVELVDGRLTFSLEGQVDPEPAGGIAAVAAIRDFELRDTEAGPLLVGVREIVIDAPRVDTDVIQVAELAMRGVRANVERDGASLLAGGLRLSIPDPAASEAKLPAAEPEAATPAAGGAAEPRVPPRIDLERLAFDVEALSIAEGGAPPLVISIDLHNEKPLAIIAPDPQDLAPWELAMRVASPTALEQLDVAIEIQPWDLTPLANLSVEMSGLHGAALHDSWPELLADLDLRAIAGAQATLDLAARLDLRRRAPTEFDLSRGFGLEMELSNVAYRATPDGEVLAGVESVFLDAPRLGGGSGAVHVAELAVDGIVGRVSRDDAGVHVLGITIPLTPEAADESANGTETTEVATSPEQPRIAEASGKFEQDAVAPPIRIDQISVNGLDFELRDTTFDPPLVMPLDDLALSVSGIRVGGDLPPAPIRFEFALGAGEIELPERVQVSSMLAGLVVATASAVTGGDDKPGLEQRNALDEVVISGSLVPTRPPSGSLEIDISGVELLALRGPAGAAGVEISDGVFDGRVTMRVDENGSTRTKASFILAHLGLSEAQGGPISTYLRLPAPLQSVVFLLKDADDEITVPLDVKFKRDGSVRGSQLAAGAVSAFGSIVTDAVASSAFRVGGMVTSLFGIGGPTEIPQEANVVLEFGPGAVNPPADTEQRIDVLLDVLRDKEMIVVVQPVLGFDDLERAEVLAAPSGPDRSELVEQLRQRKRALWRERDANASALRTSQRLGDEQACLERTEDLRRIDTHIGRTERALDSVLVLLRPDADRRVPRRARRLALEFATARAERMRDLLLEIRGEKFAGRIDVRRARLPQSEEMDSGVLLLSPRRRAQ